jgi:hypothetical protein
MDRETNMDRESKIKQAIQILKNDGICEDYFGRTYTETYLIDCFDCICSHICYDDDVEPTNVDAFRKTRLKICHQILRENKLKRILDE